jgi:hypothetical protein
MGEDKRPGGSAARLLSSSFFDDGESTHKPKCKHGVGGSGEKGVMDYKVGSGGMLQSLRQLLR